VSWPGVSAVVSCGLLRSGEGSGMTVVVGTSGESAGVVGVELGSPPAAGSLSAGGTSLGTRSLKFTEGFSAPEIGETVKYRSASAPTHPQHNSGLRSQKTKEQRYSPFGNDRSLGLSSRPAGSCLARNEETIMKVV